MPPYEEEEGGKGLHKGNVGVVEEVGSCESVLETKAEFEVEFTAWTSKIRHDLVRVSYAMY